MLSFVYRYFIVQSFLVAKGDTLVFIHPLNPPREGDLNATRGAAMGFPFHFGETYEFANLL